jgi:hypothetical protein
MALRGRIAAGECPYPDAAMAANEAFIHRLEDFKSEDVGRILRSEKRLASRDGSGLLTFLGGGAALATAIYACFCPPVLASAVVAGSAAVGARLLLHLAGRRNRETRPHQDFSRHLEAWSGIPLELPRVPYWPGESTVEGLKTLIRTFDQDVEGFPYASELREEHARFTAALAGLPDIASEEATRRLLDAPAPLPARRPDLRVLTVASNVGWVGGVAAIGMGASPVGLGLLALGAASWATKAWISARRPVGVDLSDPANVASPVRVARSLHTWTNRMKAVPPVGAEQLLFNGARAPGTIERGHEDVKIGRIVVPVKREVGK